MGETRNECKMLVEKPQNTTWKI